MKRYTIRHVLRLVEGRDVDRLARDGHFAQDFFDLIRRLEAALLRSEIPLQTSEILKRLEPFSDQHLGEEEEDLYKRVLNRRNFLLSSRGDSAK